MTSAGKAALFLDRDGVLIPDIDLLTSPDDVKLLPGVASAIAEAQHFGFVIVVITNQSVVARGLCSESDVEAVHAAIDTALIAGGAAKVDCYQYCPHHPHANLLAYRIECDCRKPKPGMLLAAAKLHDIDLSSSVMIGDRMTDVLAGHRAGCQSVLVETGMETAPLIVGVTASELVEPSFRALDLAQAVTELLR